MYTANEDRTRSDSVANGACVGAAECRRRRLAMDGALVCRPRPSLCAGSVLAERLRTEGEHGAFQTGPPVERTQHALSVRDGAEKVAACVLSTGLCSPCDSKVWPQSGVSILMMTHRHCNALGRRSASDCKYPY